MNRAAEAALRLGRPAAALLCMLLLAPASARAQDTDSRTQLEALRPTGPVTLTADSAEWVQGGEMQYQGNVSLQSDTLQLRGDSMTVTQSADGQCQAQVVGAPAHLDHAGAPEAQGLAAQPVSAQAGRIDYDSRQGVIRLSQKARLLRGGDEVTGEQIDYIVAERRIKAAGGQSGQVRIVIQPPKPDVQDRDPAPPAEEQSQ